MTDIKQTAERYFSSWRDGDFSLFRSLLCSDATFRGPLGAADGADACTEGIKGMSTMMQAIDIKAMVVDAPNVITWYDLHTKNGKVLPTANWMRFAHGKIASISATFDPRPLCE